MQGGHIRAVQPGDLAAKLASRDGARSGDTVAVDPLTTPSPISAGQTPSIPVSNTVEALPAVTASAADTCPCEVLVIASPAQGMTVTSPRTVTGWVVGPNAAAPDLVVAVLDGNAQQIGRAYGFAAGGSGKYASFAVPITFTVPANSQPGRIQVWSVSRRDGAIDHLNSVVVRLQGLELDPLLSQLDAAIKARSSGALLPLMADPFRLEVYGSQRLASPLTRAEAIQQLEKIGLDAGAPRFDFSVDARTLLGKRVALGPEVLHVVYSTGWGPEQRDDAFLLISQVDGRARWSDMIYVPAAMIDYR